MRVNRMLLSLSLDNLNKTWTQTHRKQTHSKRLVLTSPHVMDDKPQHASGSQKADLCQPLQKRCYVREPNVVEYDKHQVVTRCVSRLDYRGKHTGGYKGHLFCMWICSLSWCQAQDLTLSITDQLLRLSVRVCLGRNLIFGAQHSVRFDIECAGHGVLPQL